MILFSVDKWEEVSSSNIDAVGTKGEWLLIQFKQGHLYRYAGLAHVFTELVSADSVGKAFRQLVLEQTKGERISPLEWKDD